ncbi:hypothetical protein PR003_g10070 [Phytophthora rubi]|uniref:Uncharacterized protein n=1 Tax=Phytophthora rubi TaxID=129364 RepID=A0A6A4FGC8_9STRA|nr:hypothetical protein PR003_g10070 [Phytophthora rubi]
MVFVIHLRERECVPFDAPPAVLMALNSGRLGPRGLTDMYFRAQSEMEQLGRSSSNANFSADFGAGATLLVTTVDCLTYKNLLFIGRALTHLLVDSPHWWRNFNEAIRAMA